MPIYNFKFLQEVAWAAVVAAIVFIGGQFVALGTVDITDWKAWAFALVAGAARAAVAAIVAKLGSGSFQAS